jgi:hypothetical protein
MTKMISYEDAKFCVMLDRHDLLAREREVLEKYQEYLRMLPLGTTVDDVIRKKMDGHKILWMNNEFPYDIAGTRHYLLFSDHPLSDDKVREIALRYVGEHEFFHFVNLPRLQSVGIWHSHIIVKM